MEAYITGIGLVSPQNTFKTDQFLEETIQHNGIRARAVEPNYKLYLDPILARRMGRVIKMSIAASIECMRDANIEMPDAIITGTALGCLHATESFLLSVIDDQEQFLTPTSFIQSTHNTVSAQIALQLKCLAYNYTYVHKAFSFENALLDGLMTLKEGNAQHILVGGHDEQTDKNFLIYKRLDYWKKEEVLGKSLLFSNTQGTMSGEGAGFFMLSANPSTNTYAKLLGIKTFYKPENPANTIVEIQKFLAEKSINKEHLDLVIYGNNGEEKFDQIYSLVQETLFKKVMPLFFKHLCGEYQTATGFALWLASKILKEQNIPTSLIFSDKIHHKTFKNILIYNSFRNENHSLILLQSI